MVRCVNVMSARKAACAWTSWPPWPGLQDALALPVPAGTLVVFHGLLPHCSAANRSATSRLAYTLHVTDASAAYSRLNWLQRGPALPVRGLA